MQKQISKFLLASVTNFRVACWLDTYSSCSITRPIVDSNIVTRSTHKRRAASSFYAAGAGCVSDRPSDKTLHQGLGSNIAQLR